MGSSPRTIELWFRPVPSTAFFQGVYYGQAGVGGAVLLSCTAGELQVSVYNGIFGVQGLSLAGGWHHFVLVFPVGGTRCDEFLFYLDGQSLNPVVISGSGATLVNTIDSRLQINQFSSGYSNVCDYAEIAIYAAALSEQRIREHYLAGKLVGA